MIADYRDAIKYLEENEQNLLPTAPSTRASRLIEGFGGAAKARAQLEAPLDEGDYRWALKLGSWLVRRETVADGCTDAGAPEDRALLACFENPAFV